MKKQELKQLIRECMEELQNHSELVSNCCGARPADGTEIVNGGGVCSRCKDGAKFEPLEDDESGEQVNEGPVTKQDFVAFAEAIKNLRPVTNGQVSREAVIQMCVNIFKASNPRFEEARFRAACR